MADFNEGTLDCLLLSAGDNGITTGAGGDSVSRISGYGPSRATPSATTSTTTSSIATSTPVVYTYQGSCDHCGWGFDQVITSPYTTASDQDNAVLYCETACTGKSSFSALQSRRSHMFYVYFVISCSYQLSV